MVGDEDLRFRSCYASPAKKFGMGDRRQGFIMRLAAKRRRRRGK
jgi:hypothetical protein